MGAPFLRRFSFLGKIVAAVILVMIGDHVVFEGWSGSAGALIGFASLVALSVCRPAVVRSPAGAVALLTACAAVVVVLERPGLLAWAFVFLPLAIASLAPRARSLNALEWAQRLAGAALRAPMSPVDDAVHVRRIQLQRTGKQGTSVAHIAKALALPVLGGLLFLALFTAANPIIERALQALRLPRVNVQRLVLWVVFAVVAWMALRPKLLRLKTTRRVGRTPRPRLFPVASVIGALVVFNVLFALQNALDVAFLWSGAELPTGVTFAAYAHRGAYALIATALLAGAFVLAFLDPGSEASRSATARRLVIAWVAQNILLVASTALRTMDYVQAYAMTRMRLAALAWMLLVAVGLVLICWRLVRGKSSSWLLNANALTAIVVLAACSVLDLGTVAAAWNVGHAAELGGRSAGLDVCYLQALGETAVIPMAQVDARRLPPDLQLRFVSVRQGAYDNLRQRQSDWRSWTWRGARRLARTELLLTGQPPAWRVPCGPPSPPPLTAHPQPGR
jgi:hypothetical protein